MEIVSKVEFKAIGLKITCKEEELGVEMPKLWRLFKERVGEVANRRNLSVIDICLERKDQHYTQFICCEVYNLEKIPEGMEGIIIPQQRYVYFEHEGSEMDIWKSFGAMEKWAVDNGYNIHSSEFKMDFSSSEFNGAHKLYLKIDWEKEYEFNK